MTQPDFLLSIYLRGAADGLTFVAPYDDPVYQAKRSQTRILPPGSGQPNKEAIPLQAATGNMPAFGMPQALAPLLPAYTAGQLLFVHGTGSPDPTRSHFVQQALMERGITSWSSPSHGDGVWARHLHNVPPIGAGNVRGLSVSNYMPKILKGGPAVVPANYPAEFGFPGAAATADVRRAALADMYGVMGGVLREPFGNILTTIDELQGVDWDNYQPGGGAVYPNTDFGTRLLRAAQIAKELPGVEVVHVDKGGWDTHAVQGVFNGSMFNDMDDLAQGIAAFLADMQTHARKVMVIAVTEFGRTLKENSSAGTDHGRASVAIVAGDHANGGQVVADWPGLKPADLDGGDLAVSIDTRDLFGEILLERLGQPNLDEIFPDAHYTYTARGITA